MRFYFIGSANVQKAFKVFIHVLPTQKDWQDQFPKMYCYSGAKSGISFRAYGEILEK